MPSATWTEGLVVEGKVRIERLAIRTPIWDGKRVGVAVFRAQRSDVVEVKVLYRTREDKTLIPKILIMASTQILKYPRQHVTPTLEVCLVPMEDFREKK